MSVIKAVRARYFRVPLEEVLVDSTHGTHSHFDLVLVDVETADGAVGTGYTYTGGYGGRAIFSVLEFDLKPLLVGLDADCIGDLWHKMNWRIHYVGRGGIAGFAVSAVDMALWDLRGKRAGLPLWKLAGGRGRTAKTYAGGIDLQCGPDELRKNTRAYLSRGFHAVKIKVGRKDLAEDVERAAAVREVLGPRMDFMIDANMTWSAEKAVKAARALGRFAIYWLEEPAIPEDYRGYARIRSEGGIPVAMGENLHSIYEFRDAITVGGIDFPQPDASNTGGITGWLKVAELAAAYNLPVCSHGMQELHVSLLAGAVNGGYLEIHSFPIDRSTLRPLVLDEHGNAEAPDEPGTGVTFRREALEPHEKILFEK